MAGKVKNFQTIFDGELQTIPAVNDKGTVTITMPATAEAGEQYVLEALAKDGDNRTIGRASKTITAVNPAILRPKINIPRNSTYVINDNIPVELAPVEYTPGYAGTHVSTTYQVAADSAFTDLLCEITSTSDLTSAVLKLSRPLAQKEGAFIRVKITEDTLGESEWSEIHSVAGTQPEAPAITRPKAASLVSYRAVPVETEPMSCLGKAADTHISTDWKLTDVTGSLVYAENMGDTVNLTAYTFNKDIPKNTYAYLHVRHHGLISGVGVWATRPIQISEEEIPVAPTITFPREYCHPKNISILLSKLVVLNMAEYRCIGAQYKIALDTEGENILYDSGQVDNCERHDLSLSTPLEPRAKVYFFARQREETVGWTPWCAPVGMLAAKTATPSFLFPKDGGQVYETIFTASISEFRTQGLTSDTHISTDWEITTDDGETELFRSTGDMVNLTTIPIALSEDLMGSYIRLRVRVTGEYTGPSAWVTARVLLHLPMHVFAPTITVPAAGAYIGMREVAVQTSPFLTENVDVPKHAATLVRVTYDEEGLKTAFLSSEITLGDKTKYTINFGAPPTAAVLYISARHKDDFAGWSEWGVPQRVALAAPVAPTIIAPVSTDLIGFADITVRLSGYALEGGITGMPHKDTHIVVKDRDTGEVYLDMLAGGPLLTIPLEGTQSMVNKWVTLEASFIGENAGEGKTASVTFKIRRISQGVRLGGGATVVGMPDGSPFTIKGKKLFIAVADSAFRTADGLAYGPAVDTYLPNAPYIPGALPVLTVRGTSYPSVVGVAEAALDKAVPLAERDSRHNTHVLTTWGTSLAASASEVMIGNLWYELPSVDALMRIIQRGEYIDSREEQTGVHVFGSETGGFLWSSTETSSSAAYCGFAFAPGVVHPNKDGSGVAWEPLTPGCCPVFELPYEGLENAYVTLPAPEIITYTGALAGKDLAVSIRANPVPADTPMKEVRLTVDGGEEIILPTKHAYARYTVSAAEPKKITVTAKAVAVDGTESPVATLEIDFKDTIPAAPAVTVPAFIQATKVDIRTSAFVAPAGVQTSHRYTQYQICADSKGEEVIYDSGDSTQLTKLVVTLSAPLTPRATVYILARHKASDGTVSPWSVAAQSTVTYETAPTISSPIDGATINVAIGTMQVTRGDMAGGIPYFGTDSTGGGQSTYPTEVVAQPTVTREIVSEDENETYFSETLTWAEWNKSGKSLRAKGVPRNTPVRIRVRFNFGFYGASDWATVRVVTANTRMGERICGIATVISMANGDPFEDWQGAKYYIAVTDKEHWTVGAQGDYVTQCPLVTPMRATPSEIVSRSLMPNILNVSGTTIDMAFMNEVQSIVCAKASSTSMSEMRATSEMETYMLKALALGNSDVIVAPWRSSQNIPVTAVSELGCEDIKFCLPSLGDCARIAASWHILEDLNGEELDFGTSSQAVYHSIRILGSTLNRNRGRSLIMTEPDAALGGRKAAVGSLHCDAGIVGAHCQALAASGSIDTDLISVTPSADSWFVPIAILPYDDESAKLLDVNMAKTYGPDTTGGKNVIRQWLPPVGNVKRPAYPRSLIELTAGERPVDDRMYMVTPSILASGAWGDPDYCAVDPLMLYYKDKTFWILNNAHRKRIAALSGGTYEKYVANLTFGEFSDKMRMVDGGVVYGSPMPVSAPRGTATVNKTVRVTRLKFSKLYYAFLNTNPAVGSSTATNSGGYHTELRAKHTRLSILGQSNVYAELNDPEAPLAAVTVGWNKFATGPFERSFEFQEYGVNAQHIKLTNAAWGTDSGIRTSVHTGHGVDAQWTLALFMRKGMNNWADADSLPPGLARLGFRYDPDDPYGEIPDSDYNY